VFHIIEKEGDKLELVALFVFNAVWCGGSMED
jgi:hypothetical protein